MPTGGCGARRPVVTIDGGARPVWLHCVMMLPRYCDIFVCVLVVFYLKATKDDGAVMMTAQTVPHAPLFVRYRFDADRTYGFAALGDNTYPILRCFSLFYLIFVSRFEIKESQNEPKGGSIIAQCGRAGCSRLSVVMAGRRALCLPLGAPLFAFPLPPIVNTWSKLTQSGCRSVVFVRWFLGSAPCLKPSSLPLHECYGRRS